MMLNNNTSGFFRKRREDKSNRPLVMPEKEPVDWVLEGVALLGLMVFLGFALYQYPRLPQIIPSHFNAEGVADDYSSKSSFWMLPVVAGFIYALLTIVALIPHQLNYAVKITPANALKQYRLAMRLVRYLKAFLIWMFFYIAYAAIHVAFGSQGGLGLWFLPVTLAFVFVPLITYLVISSRYR